MSHAAQEELELRLPYARGTPPPAMPADGGTFAVHPLHDPQRRAVEEFIARVYARHYGATVTHFAPVLVSLRDPGGVIAAAAGYRGAGVEPLFLERYLEAPVEALLGAHARRAPARVEVVEIGHLAAERAGAGRSLMFALGPHLAQEGFRWAVATLTQELRLLMSRMGITPLALGSADPARLGEDAALWGSYYDHAPLVLAGELQAALRRLARRGAVAGSERA